MTIPERATVLVVLIQRARRRPAWALLPILVLTLIGFAVGSWRASGYVAQSSLHPKPSTLPLGNLSGLASQFGLNVATGTQSEPIEYYARLLKSRDLLRAVVTTEYTVNEELDPTRPPRLRQGDLPELLHIKTLNRDEAIYRAIRRLDAMLAVRLDIPSGIITLRTSADNPDLAAQLNGRAIEVLTAFNLEKRRSRARAEREFVAERARMAGDVLDSTELVLQQFLEQNRDYRASPRLRFEAERIERAVSLRQQVFTSALQALEQALVEEVRNTPVITVIDGPNSWVLPNGGRLLMTGIGVLLGSLIALLLLAAMPQADALVFDLRESFRRRSNDPTNPPGSPPPAAR